jgi:hypothetical protein
MARPKTKLELIQSSQDEYNKLLELVNSIPESSLSESGVCESWSVKDILAHLHAWHMLFLTWYQEGMAGSKPAMPAPGLTWKQTPELNHLIYLEYLDECYEDILTSLKESFQEVFSVIQKHTDQELFTKKLYKWTGSTSMGSYLVSATASHYAWAQDLIKKWKKNNLPREKSAKVE